MSQAASQTPAEYVLPPSVVSKLDFSHLVAELEKLDAELTATSVRQKAGFSTTNQLTYSQQLNDFLAVNQLEIGDSQQRSNLLTALRTLKDNLPVIHMTFAVEADQDSLEKLSSWLRQSVHPQAVISVGLQPGLIGGVYLRTPNHIRDLSVRAQLEGHRGVLVRELEALGGNR